MSTDTRQKIEALHALYGQLTGLVIPLDMQRESIWYEWQRRGHDAQALREVVAHLRRGIRDQKRNPGALKFRNLIGMPDYFEEDLAEARAARRAFQSRPQGHLASVLKSTGRLVEPKGEAKTIAEIVRSPAFEQFKQFSKNLKKGPDETR
jgi:hypothetical protein